VLAARSRRLAADIGDQSFDRETDPRLCGDRRCERTARAANAKLSVDLHDIHFRAERLQN
jgi:hypothetical protein